MLKKLILCHNINKFYATMFKGVCPKWSVKDLDNKNTLQGILFDINLTFGKDDTKFSNNLKKSILELGV